MPNTGIAELALAIGLLCSFGATEVRAEATDQAALARALEAAGATLEDGLEAAVPVGRPISAKFEIAKGRLQLSVYTATGEGYAEAFVSTSTGVLMATEKMTDSEDLEAAAEQKKAIQPATTTLAAATARRALTFALPLLVFCSGTSRAESFHRLSGAQIRTQVTGKVITDGTHWRETYAPRRKLFVEEMGHSASIGSWRIDGDRLCKVRPGILNECYEHWIAGDRVEFRLGEFPPLEGFLRTDRNK